MARRVLAIGHDAYRAGAQIVFLHILRWLREHHDSDLTLTLLVDGELRADYEAVLPTTVLAPAPPGARTGPSAVGTIGKRLRRRGVPPAPRGLDSLGLGPGSVDLVYANSVTSAPFAVAAAAQAQCPVVCHVHELEMSIQRFTSAAKFRDASRAVDHFVAVSEAVRRNLVANHAIDESRISLVPECIVAPAAPDPRRVDRIRAELGIPAGAFVVGGSGTLDWRTGPDVFLLVARAMAARDHRRPVHFVWVGGEEHHLPTVVYDRDRLGLADRVHLVGVQADPTPWFALFDAFFLSSREDPFPLVCLEAAALGVPTVCFADAGGMPEFVQDDAGIVVGYLDLDAAADRLGSLVDNDETRATLGANAAIRVARQCTVDVVGPQVAEIIDRHLS